MPFFALAMFNFQGRATTKNLEEAARLLEAAAKLGHTGAAYDLGLLYLQGQQFPQDLKRAGELFAIAAEGGNPEAQYALATMYKEGRGAPKDMGKAMLLMRQASVAGNIDAMVEFAIAQFNGEGVNKDETAAAQLFLKAAHLGNPIAQNRLARILMAGRGMPAGRHRGDQVAYGCQGRRQQRSRPRRVCRKTEPNRPRSRRGRRQEMAIDHDGRPPLTALGFAGRPLAVCTTRPSSMS